MSHSIGDRRSSPAPTSPPAQASLYPRSQMWFQIAEDRRIRPLLKDNGTALDIDGAAKATGWSHDDLSARWLATWYAFVGLKLTPPNDPYRKMFFRMADDGTITPTRDDHDDTWPIRGLVRETDRPLSELVKMWEVEFGEVRLPKAPDTAGWGNSPRRC